MQRFILGHEPATGWQDPLHTYFTHALLMGGGLRGGSTLSSKPVTVDANLNEWVRFDEPGTYTLSITSHREVGKKPQARVAWDWRTF